MGFNMYVYIGGYLKCDPRPKNVDEGYPYKVKNGLFSEPVINGYIEGRLNESTSFHYFLSNHSSTNVSLSDEDWVTRVKFTEESVIRGKNLFIAKHSNEIAKLKQVYGDGNVHLEVGVIQYCTV